MCQVAWRIGKVREGWTLVVIVPIYKGISSRELCKNYSGSSLLSITVTGNIYGSVIVEKLREITKGRIGGASGIYRR